MLTNIGAAIRKAVEILQSPDLLRELYYNHIGVPPRIDIAISPRAVARPLERKMYRRTREADGNFTEHLVPAGTLVVRVEDQETQASGAVVAQTWATQLAQAGGWQDDIVDPTPWIRVTLVCVACALAGAALTAMVLMPR